MKILKSKIDGIIDIRTEKDYPKKGIEFIDIMPIIMNATLYQNMIQLFIVEMKDKKIDYVLAPEARGFLIGSIVANQLGVGCIPVRKEGKLPPSAVESTFEYEKEYGKDKLSLPKLVEDRKYEGLNFYIIDDIYATGNTVKAIEKEIQRLGGIIEGKGVLINIVGLNQEQDVFSILEVEEE